MKNVKLAIKKILFFLLVGMLSAEVKAQSDSPKEAWIAFATSNYFELLEVTIASVHEFSSRPIIAVGVDADIPFSTEKYPRLIKKRVNSTPNLSLFYQKPRIILESDLDYGIYIEADDILNQGCDDLFNYAYLEREYPLCPCHPHDPNDQQNLMTILGVQKKSMHYVHGHVVFSKKCLPFVQEWYDHCLTYRNLASNFDETILNILLWKHEVTELLPLYDPYFQAIHEYLPLSLENVRSTPPYCYWSMFHGCKNPEISWKILEELRTRYLKN